MSMADRDGLIWFDGKMVPWRDAKVHCNIDQPSGKVTAQIVNFYLHSWSI